MAPRDRPSIRKVATSGPYGCTGTPNSGIGGRRRSMEVALPTVGSRPVQPEKCATSLPAPAATLATASFHMVEHL